MYIQKNRANRARKVVANDEVFVEPEATDLLFEAEDVAELVAEVTGEPVEVAAEGDVVTFTVSEDEYTVTAEGDEEILESRRMPKKPAVKASQRRRPTARPTVASRQMRRRPVKANRSVSAKRQVVRPNRVKSR